MTALFARAGLMAACLLALGPAHAMTKDEYKVQQDRIEADYKAARRACDSLAGNAKDVCTTDAKGRHEVAEAELAYTQSGKASDHDKLAKARAKATYETAKQKCDALKGNDKDVCVQEAKAAETRALTDAKAGKEMREVRKDANEDVNEAQYKVAKEKCDALSGDAKDRCQADAKARYGK